MLIKRGKTIKKFRVFLERIEDSEFPYACRYCLLKNKRCSSMGFDCNDYDTYSYSFVVKKKLRKKKK